MTLTPEETELLKQLFEQVKATQRSVSLHQRVLFEIKTMFEQFTNEKKHYWKDEQIRRRERTWRQ